MIEQFIEINKLLKKSKEAKELYSRKSSIIITEAKQKMFVLRNLLVEKANIDQNIFKPNLSIGQPRIASSPWIGFYVKETAHIEEAVYITLFFLPKNNQIFLTLQGKSKNYKKRGKETLFNVFEFYKNKYLEIKNKYNLSWNNNEVPDLKLIKEQNYDSFANSYLFTSIFYELIDLNEMNDEVLIAKIKELFDIFLSVDLFYTNPLILKNELDNFLKLKEANKNFEDSNNNPL